MTRSIIAIRRRRRLRGKARRCRDAEIRDAIAKIRAIHAGAKAVTADEIRAWKHEGHSRAGLTSKMPDDLRAIALEGLNQPYEP